MPDISTMDGVAAADIGSIDGFAKANISTLGGVSVPASGATQWGIGTKDAGVGYAASSDLTSWTAYEPVASGVDLASSSQDFVNLTYGKDDSGNPLWALVWGNGTMEIIVNDDITDQDGWGVNHLGTTGNKQYAIAWGEDGSGGNQWISIGKFNSTRSLSWRSATGHSWSSVDMTGLSGWNYDKPVFGIATDGAGTFMFPQEDRIYRTVDGGANWTLAHDFNTVHYKLKNIVYTNSSWVVLGEDEEGADNTIYLACAASDVTDWTAYDSGIGTSVDVQFAAAAGTVICSNGSAWERFTVSGKTISSLVKHATGLNNGPLPGFGNAGDVAGDGGGNWIIVGNAGDICTSTDDGVNFSQSVNGLAVEGTQVEDIQAVAANVYLPL